MLYNIAKPRNQCQKGNTDNKEETKENCLLEINSQKSKYNYRFGLKDFAGSLWKMAPNQIC